MDHRRGDRRLLVAASGLSSFGDELAIIALALRVEALTNSSLAVAGLFIAGALPMVLLAPVAGLVVDRTETVRTLRLVSAVQAVVALALAITTTFSVILLLAFILGALAAVANPAVFALVPVVTPEDALTKTNANMETARYAGAMLGPVTAGLLVAGPGVPVAMIVNAITFVGIAVAAMLFHATRPPLEVHEGAARGEARAGFAHIARDRLLLLAFVVIGVMIVFAASDNVAEVFFAKDVLGAPALGYAILATVWIAGMVVGAFVLARRLSPGRLVPGMLVAALTGGAAVVAAALIGRLVPAALLFFVGGMSNGVENVSMRSLIHHRTPEAIQGRVFAAYGGLASATQIVATLLGGVLVGVIGARQALVIGGAGTAAVAIVGFVWFAALPSAVRRVEDRSAATEDGATTTPA